MVSPRSGGSLTADGELDVSGSGSATGSASGARRRRARTRSRSTECEYPSINASSSNDYMDRESVIAKGQNLLRQSQSSSSSGGCVPMIPAIPIGELLSSSRSAEGGSSCASTSREVTEVWEQITWRPTVVKGRPDSNNMCSSLAAASTGPLLSVSKAVPSPYRPTLLAHVPSLSKDKDLSGGASSVASSTNSEGPGSVGAAGACVIDRFMDSFIRPGSTDAALPPSSTVTSNAMTAASAATGVICMLASMIPSLRSGDSIDEAATAADGGNVVAAPIIAAPAAVNPVVVVPNVGGEEFMTAIRSQSPSFPPSPGPLVMAQPNPTSSSGIGWLSSAVAASGGSRSSTPGNNTPIAARSRASSNATATRGPTPKPVVGLSLPGQSTTPGLLESGIAASGLPQLITPTPGPYANGPTDLQAATTPYSASANCFENRPLAVNDTLVKRLRQIWRDTRSHAIVIECWSEIVETMRMVHIHHKKAPDADWDPNFVAVRRVYTPQRKLSSADSSLTIVNPQPVPATATATSAASNPVASKDGVASNSTSVNASSAAATAASTGRPKSTSSLLAGGTVGNPGTSASVGPAKVPTCRSADSLRMEMSLASYAEASASKGAAGVEAGDGSELTSSMSKDSFETGGHHHHHLHGYGHGHHHHAGHHHGHPTHKDAGAGGTKKPETIILVIAMQPHRQYWHQQPQPQQSSQGTPSIRQGQTYICCLLSNPNAKSGQHTADEEVSFRFVIVIR
jgi:hypothetical protein